MRVEITVNGRLVGGEVEERSLLSEFLRETAGLKGVHRGCDTAQCGACTIHLDGVAVKSCNVLALQAEGRDVTTIEGIRERDGALHPVQQAFHECHGLQCGFCTPGMMMTARHLLDHNPDPDEATIREAISGQICRCTGYENIVRAVRHAAGHPSQPSGASAADRDSEGASTVAGEPSQEVPA
jgi:carbon-monoxide dehydrogenase small subunit